MKKILLTVAVAAIAAAASASRLTDRIAAKYRVKTTDVWYGGYRTVFDFNGYDAWVVEPPSEVKPAAGTPWTWTIQWRTAYVPRTSVPRLLAMGWHHAAIDTFRHRMDETGLKVSAAFQEFLVRELGFAPKTCLIGMSWGGFFSTRYAATYPDNVAKIYLDCPFMTFDGCTVVKDIGPWAARKPAEGWANDPNMPINLCGKVAAAKIPVLLLYGGQDGTLNPDYNARAFIRRFQAAGGTLKYTERPYYGHHPHGVEVDENTVIYFFTGK